MREIIQTLNKRSLAEATGISYRRLRSYSSGALEELNDDEIQRIYDYLITIAQEFNK